MVKISPLLVILGLYQSCAHVLSFGPNIEDLGPIHSRVRRLSGVPKPVWHVAIYAKDETQYPIHICGGTVVRNDVVISAAHCFMNGDKLSQPSKFAVAGNKNYRMWSTDLDPDAQKSEVKEILIPPQYHGQAAKYQSDIAVLRLSAPFQHTRGLRPACVHFDGDAEGAQLKDGNRGTIAGWGLTGADGKPSPSLLWTEPPYVSPERCVASVPTAFIGYITWDKICAGDNSTGKALCKGDSGGGLIFWRGRGASAVPYLRGIASTAPNIDRLCNVFTVGAYTRVSAHRAFLLAAVPGLDQCQYEMAKAQPQPNTQLNQTQHNKDGLPVWQL